MGSWWDMSWAAKKAHEKVEKWGDWMDYIQVEMKVEHLVVMTDDSLAES